MNWSKAKSIIIFFLIAINLVLMTVLVYSNTSNSLSSERKKAIIKLLNQNGIELHGEMPEDYSPLPTISLTYRDNNIEELKNMFFADSNNVKRSVEFNYTILREGNRTLTIDGSKIKYTDEDYQNDISTLEELTAKKMVEEFIKNKLKNEYSHYKFHSTTVVNNKLSLKYYEIYSGYKLYSNYIRFEVTDNGISYIEIVNYEPTGIIGIARDICSADEALLTFMYEIINKDLRKDIVINKIELGYALEEKAKRSADSRAIPCYRISIDESENIYYINAYTNTLM